MRIAIVNDMPLAVESLRRIVCSVPRHTLAWVARDGKEALQKCAADRPDMILMDLIMPLMNGVEATATIMREMPCPILVVTATVSGNAAMVFEAMGCGALDAVTTPTIGFDGNLLGGNDLLHKISIIERLVSHDRLPATNEQAAVSLPKSTNTGILAIGASTGGPGAILNILKGIAPNPPFSIVLIQHVDVSFADGLADWLTRESTHKVVIAQEGQAPQNGVVHIAATNDHLMIGSDLKFHYVKEPLSCPFRPSVDVFFSSLQSNWPSAGVAVLLTGIGKDGAQGLLGLRSSKWHTIAQDEKSSIIYGMPKAAAELKAAREILPLSEIAASVMKFPWAARPATNVEG